MIVIKNLYKSYGPNQVLDNLNLEIQEKESLVILGRSGVGKSVLLRQIIGIEKPDSGSVLVNGLEISSLNKKNLYRTITDMGMLFQGSALFDSMNIYENTAFYLRQHGNPESGKPYEEKEIQEKVNKALTMVGLESEGKKMPSDLSGGMKKRAGLARLIVYRPKILLYDEPTTGLDPITAQQINELIVKTQEELQGTTIVVTHDMHSALYIADRIALHKDGRIAYIEEPEKFLEIDDPIINFLKNAIRYHPRAKEK